MVHLHYPIRYTYYTGRRDPRVTVIQLALRLPGTGDAKFFKIKNHKTRKKKKKEEREKKKKKKRRSKKREH